MRLEIKLRNVKGVVRSMRLVIIALKKEVEDNTKTRKQKHLRSR